MIDITTPRNRSVNNDSKGEIVMIFTPPIFSEISLNTISGSINRNGWYVVVARLDVISVERRFSQRVIFSFFMETQGIILISPA